MYAWIGGLTMYAPISDAAMENNGLIRFKEMYGYDYFDPSYDDLDVLFDDEDEDEWDDEEWEIDLEEV